MQLLWVLCLHAVMGPSPEPGKIGLLLLIPQIPPAVLPVLLLRHREAVLSVSLVLQGREAPPGHTLGRTS